MKLARTIEVDLIAPIGFQFKGSYRTPRIDEWFYFNGKAMQNSWRIDGSNPFGVKIQSENPMGSGCYWILQKLEDLFGDAGVAGSNSNC